MPYHFTGPETAGPGRPKGSRNVRTMAQRTAAEMVLGKPGTPEFDLFIALERAALLDGTMHPATKQLWMHYGFGKPIERVEVKDTTNTLEDISPEVLRTRSLELAVLAQRLSESESLPERGDGESSVH